MWHTKYFHSLQQRIQSGFRPGRSTIDQTFSMRQVLEKTRDKFQGGKGTQVLLRAFSEGHFGICILTLTPASDRRVLCSACH